MLIHKSDKSTEHLQTDKIRLRINLPERALVGYNTNNIIYVYLQLLTNMHVRNDIIVYATLLQSLVITLLASNIQGTGLPFSS